MTRHGLVLGKFYPPHGGHVLLIRTAAEQSDQVTVLVLAYPSESLAVDSRVAWLRAELADSAHVTVVGGIDPHPVDYDDPAVWDAHMVEFRRVLAHATSEPVTTVFTSEGYGPELARRFDAVHVAVDVNRSRVPVSGTAVRANPLAHWSELPGSVRGGLAKRVVVIGAESTGTTTMTELLAETLRQRGGAFAMTRSVPEYGRLRTIEKLAEARRAATFAGRAGPTMADLDWPSSEFVEIADEQNRLEDEAAIAGGPVLLCDTDAFATAIWHERYCGDRSADVEARGRMHPLYLVTHHDGVPFEQDGLRDGEHLRPWMTTRIEEELAATGRRSVVLTGSLDMRLAVALDAVDTLVAEGWKELR